MKRFTLFALVAVLAFVSPVSAQTALTQTTLSSAITSASSRTVVVASATSIAAGTELFVDHEAMIVTAVSSTTLTVTRGADGTLAATHASGAIVFASISGTSTGFGFRTPSGSCTATDEPVLPIVSVGAGAIYHCIGSRWSRQDFGTPSVTVLARTAVSNANYTAKLSDTIIGYTSVTSSKTVTLPAATGLVGKWYIISDEGGNCSSGTTTIAISGTVDGSAAKAITSAYGSLLIYSDGTNWHSF